MSEHVVEEIWDWIQDHLSEPESARVEAHVAECEACAAALDEQLLVLARFEAARAERPKSGLRNRLLGDATTLARFQRYTDTVASAADVTREQAEAWLGRLEDAEVWEETALEDMNIFHIDGGEAVSDAVVGFVKLQPGFEFPEHTHVGAETVVVLQGVIIDEDGARHGPGSVMLRDAGTTHEISAAPGHPAIYLSIVQEGLEIFGMVFGPDSPAW